MADTPRVISRSINEHFDRFAVDYDQSAEWCADQTLIDVLASGVSGKRVLDLGCGTGLLLQAIRGAGVQHVGMDLSSSMLCQAQMRGAGPLVQAAAESIPLASESFDVVICRQMLHYAREAEVLCEVVRILREGGEFRLAQVTSSGSSDFPFWSVFKALLQPLRRRYYMPDFLISLVTLCGLDITSVARHCIRRRYGTAELFLRSPLDEDGRRRAMSWIKNELKDLQEELQPYVTENELVVNQHWTLLTCRRPRGGTRTR